MQKLKKIHNEIEIIEKKLLYYEIYKDTKDIFDEYNKKSFLTKDSFYKNHQEKIEKHQRIKAQLQNLMGTDTKLQPKKWEQEKRDLTNELTQINKDKEKIKDEYKEINHIKYSVDVVNEELGIDLSIEIDNLIKCGEKPSVIAQIQKFQDQINKDKEDKESMKQKKMDKER